MLVAENFFRVITITTRKVWRIMRQRRMARGDNDTEEDDMREDDRVEDDKVELARTASPAGAPGGKGGFRGRPLEN